VEVPPKATGVAVQWDSGPPNEPKSTKSYITFLVLCLVSLIAAMDAVIVASCLPAITADLKSTTADAFWCGTGFLLTQMVGCKSTRASRQKERHVFWLGTANEVLRSRSRSTGPSVTSSAVSGILYLPYHCSFLLVFYVPRHRTCIGWLRPAW